MASITRGIIVESAAEADHEFVVALGASEFAAYGDYGEILGEWLEYSGPRVWIASCEGERAGFAMLAPRRGIGFRRRVWAELVGIVVTASHRGTGVGRALLTHTEAAALEWQAGEVRLHTACDNHAAQGFFAAAGFRDSGRQGATYPNGQPALEYVKNLR